MLAETGGDVGERGEGCADVPPTRRDRPTEVAGRGGGLR